MPQVINTNVMSLNAQRNLSTSGSQLATALQRLSSGLRINSAKDDAAGLAIAERFTTQIRGLNQAARNANDGISLAQTGEGALAEITNNLQRIRELAVQAANSTNSASDRLALDQEVQQRLAEIQRIATQTSFNGQKILDGTFGTAAFQVGANAGETISIGLSTSMKTTDIGQIASTTSADIRGLFASGLTLTAGQLTIDGQDVVGTFTSAADMVAVIDGLGIAGLTVAAVGNELQFTNSSGAAIAIGGTANPLGITSVAAATTYGAGLTLAAGELTIDVDGAGAGAAVDITGSWTDINDLVSDINTAVGSNIASVGAGGELLITNTSTTNQIVIGGTQAAALGLATVDAATPAVPPAGLTLNAGEFTVDFGDGAGPVDLQGTYADLQELADAINNAAAAADGGNGVNFQATVNNGDLVLTNNTGGDVTFGGTGSYVNDYGIGTAGVIADGASDTAVAFESEFDLVGTPQEDGTHLSSGVAAALAAAGATNGTATTTGLTAQFTTQSLQIATGDLLIQVGDGDAVDLAGTYSNAQALVDQINASVAGAFASYDSTTGELSLYSLSAMTLSGTRYDTDFGFAAASVTVEGDASSLAAAAVTSVSAANETILRVDAALTAVNTLRGTLGAIQNRFESTITNLSTASENLTASRSRIQDADFAAETANLTRAQILQQAGTAILAQANAVPQNVLSLLR